MSRNCFSRFQSAFVLSILAVVALMFAAGSVQASLYTGLLVDRGLPTFGVNATYPGGGVDWALRSNIGDGDYDSKDPINGSSPAEIPSDDFTLPVGNLGTADPTFQITDIRIWIEGSSTLSFSQEFNSIGLMLGPKNGTLTNLDITPTVTTVSYPNGQSPGSVLWQLDFSVNLTATSGQAFSYAIVPNAKPCPYNTSGNDESYYIAFEEAVMQFAQTGINPSGDGYVGDYYLNGTPADSYTFPAVWGGVQAGDFAIQVFGTHTGTTYTWGSSAGGVFNWNDTTQWSPTGFPNAVDDVANIPAGNLTIDMGGNTYTVGTMNVTGNWMWNPGLANLRNGTLIFQTSGGNAALTDTINPWGGPDTISANVQLASPLTVSMPEYGQWGISNNALNITGVVSGSYGFTKTGPGTIGLTNIGNNFTGNINVQDGVLAISTWGAIPAADLITLGGVGTTGYLYITDSSAITRPLVLTGEGGGLYINTWLGNGWPASAGNWTSQASPTAATLDGVISGTGDLFINQGYATTFDGTADNTYVGNTHVMGWANVLTTYRALKGNVTIMAGGMVNLASSNNLDPTASVCVGSTQMASPVDSVMGVLSVMGDFVPTLAPNSSGVLSLLANEPGAMYEQGTTGPNINAALAVGAPQLGNGYMSIGAAAPPGNPPMGETFTGATLQPDIDNVFRFYISNAGFTLDSGGAGVLTDVGGVPCSVTVSGPANIWGTNGMGTNNANTFSGSLTINPDMYFQGWTQGSGSPFGAATGDVNLNGGILDLSSYNGAPAMVTKNNLNLQGQTALWFWTGGTNCLTEMTVANIVRNNNAILAISPNWGGTVGVLGTNVFLYDTNPPVNGDNGTMAPAYFVRYGGEGFLRYDSVKGFVDATFTATNGFGANNGTDIVNLTGNTVVPSGANVYALRANGSLTGGDITIAGGGLILNGSGTQGSNLVSTTNINFGSAEGIIYLSGHSSGWSAGYNELDGTISGSGGLTFGGCYYGNGASYVYLNGNNAATLTGPITINMGIVEINSDNALGNNSNPIILNGGSGNNGNCAVGALAVNSPGAGYGNNVPMYNPITVGPNGGTILCEYTQGNFSFYGPISGPGTLTIAGHPGDPVYLYNANNTWTGGTYINNCTLYVEPGSNIGPGPVILTGGGSQSINLLGTTGTNSTNDIDLYDSWGFNQDCMLNVMAASATIGALSGNGRVMLNAWQSQANTVLTFGNSESSDFYGIIQDCWTSNTGSLVYAGTGTFTMWGEGTYRGSTTINSGTFAVNGAIAGSGVTVNSGGTLSGAGLVNTSVSVVAGGTLAGGLTIDGSVTVSGVGATTNTNNATINGTFWTNSSGAAAMTNSTINGTTNIGPTGGGAFYATFTGNGNTFNGPLSVIAGVTATGSTFSGSNNTINGILTVGKPTAGRAACTFTGSNTVNSQSTYTILENGTISGSNTFNTGAMYVNYANVALCTLSGSNTINGPTYLSANSTGSTFPASTDALVSGSNTFNGSVTIYGGTFEGPNTVNGSLTTVAGSNAIVAPSADSVSAHTLTVVGNVALDHTAALDFNLGTPGTVGGGISDLITITGNLSLDGTLNVTGLTGFGVGTYTIMTYTGTLTEPSGALTLGTMPSGMGYTYTIDTSTTGQVNLDVVIPWAPGDVNHDGALNSLDIDAIYHNFGAPATSQWKVDGDGNVVGQGDVTYELHTYFHTNYGDANLDTKTDFSDFQVLLDHWQVSGPTIGWAQGDFNGSYSVDFLDFQTLLDYWNPGGWSFAPAQTPEPASLTLLLLGGLALLRRRK